MSRNITVLLSTYNGEKFLREQIDSILSQDGVDVKLVVRDDGSKDNTTNILSEYQKFGSISYYHGHNLGAARSFMQLLIDAPESEYYAFSDQDDYWKPEKLKVAIESLETYEEKPALYFSQTQLADKNLNLMNNVIINPLLTFGESLVYEFVCGCTIVMNRKLRDTLVTYIPQYMSMHDAWAYNVASAIGAEIIFDKTPHILYRQHSQNTIGIRKNIFLEWEKRIKRLVRNEHLRFKRAEEIKKGFYSLMPNENVDILDVFLNGKRSFSSRIKLLLDNRYRCSHKGTMYLFKLAVLINTY